MFGALLDFVCPSGQKRAAAADGWNVGPWYNSRAKTQSNVVVNEELALTLAACWCASRILSEGVADRDLITYQRLDEADTSRKEAIGTPIHDLLRYFPNELMGSTAMRTGRTLHQVNMGNGFAEIERDPRTEEPIALWPIHPGRVRPMQPGDKYRDGTPVPMGSYLVRNNDGGTVVILAKDMLHIPGAHTEDGVWGKSVIAYARESLGLGIAGERQMATNFGNGNMPRAVLLDPDMADPEQRREYRNDWKTMHGSPDSGEIAIIWHRDAKLEKLAFSPADSQFLELLDYNQNQISKWYRIPPHMLSDLRDSKYATVEALGLEFVTYSLFPWCKRWEEQCNLKLFNKDERRRYYVQHDFNGLLRGDFMARMTAYRTAIMDGVMNINECRRLENMNSIGPNGDKYFFPANMMTVDDIVAGKGGQSGQPGSDHTGSANDGMPGALPMPQGGDSAAVFHEWTKHLLKSDREELYSRLDRIEQSLKADARAAALPVSTPDDGRAKKKLAKQKAAIETVFRDAFARLLTKESKAADRAAANKTLDFAGWLDEFYADHEATAIEALRPACAMAAAIGVRAKPKKLARRLCAESRRLLTDGYNTLTRAKLSAMLAEWPTARAVAAAKFACGGPGSGKPGPCSEGGEGPKEPDESQDQHIVKAYESLDSDSQTIDTQVNEMADRADGENAEEIRKEAESYLSEMADDAESYIDDATNEIVDDIGENYDPGDDDKWQETFDSAEQEFRDAMEKTKDGLRSEYESVGGTVGDYADAVASGDDEKKNEFDKAIKDTQSKLDSAAEKVLDEMTQATVIMLARVQGLKPTTKQSLRTKLSCGGKGGRPGPCPGQKQKKPTKEKNKNKETKNEETKTKINVSNKGDEKSNQEVQKIVDDLPESHRSFLDANGVSVQTSSRIDHEGTHPQGTYDPESKTVTVSDDAKGQLTRAEVTRHEIGHAIDMARPIGERLSEDKEFKKAFMKDWKNREKTKNMDTAYFFSHPREAFAQGYSYLTGDMSYTGHEKAFPNTIKWMRKNLPKRGIEL